MFWDRASPLKTPEFRAACASSPRNARSNSFDPPQSTISPGSAKNAPARSRVPVNGPETPARAAIDAADPECAPRNHRSTARSAPARAATPSGIALRQKVLEDNQTHEPQTPAKHTDHAPSQKQRAASLSRESPARLRTRPSPAFAHLGKPDPADVSQSRKSPIPPRPPLQPPAHPAPAAAAVESSAARAPRHPQPVLEVFSRKPFTQLSNQFNHLEVRL